MLQDEESTTSSPTISSNSSSCNSSNSSGSNSESALSDDSDDDVFERLPANKDDFPSFKIVGDNIDKYVKPREMRLDAQAKCLNFFNSYGVKGRLDVSQLEDTPCLPDLSSFKEEKLLPTATDDAAVKTNFVVLVARVLQKHMPFFKHFAAGMLRHIKHEHYLETSQKSEVVSVLQ